jgi:putative ABC transport system ATP-binding protein
MTLIEITSLSRTFVRGGEEIHALRDVNLSIDRGESIAITGPSGSGKSTLMYILGLLDLPTSGVYRLAGDDAGQLSDQARSAKRNREIGFVFQTFHLIPRASALRNVMMPLVYAGAYGVRTTEQEREDLARRALDRVGLSSRISHMPNELSGGQRQRVAIARAIVNRPSLLLADEPTGNLDSKSGGEVLALFDELHRSGVTVILVTHDREVASRAQRIITFRDGVIVEDRHAP